MEAFFITVGYVILFLLSTNVHNVVHILFVKQVTHLNNMI